MHISCIILFCYSKAISLFRPDPLYEAIFTCTGNPVRSIGTQAQVGEEDISQTFTAMNSFWFILASLLGQGVDILPRWVFFSSNMFGMISQEKRKRH